MAHQLDFQKGSAGFVSYKTPAWHGLGKVIETQMSVEQAIKYANLDFTVGKLPNIHRIPTGQYDAEGQAEILDIETGKSFFTYRTDTNLVLGDRLGSTYQVIQNEEALAVCDTLVQQGGLIIETAGSLFDGRTVFMCCRLPEPMKVAGTDKVNQYVMIAAGHDGGTPILAYFTSVRVVCNNTLQMSLNGAVQKLSIRHTRSAKSRLDEAFKIMGIVAKNQDVAAEKFDQMAQTQMNQNNFWDYLGNVFFSGEEVKALREGGRPTDIISTRKTNVLNDVLGYAQNGIGQAEANPGSAWWAYNSVTGYFSNKKADDANDRMQSLLWGSEAATMERALQFAAAPEKIIPLKNKSLAGGMDFQFNQN